MSIKTYKLKYVKELVDGNFKGTLHNAEITYPLSEYDYYVNRFIDCMQKKEVVSPAYGYKFIIKSIETVEY